MTRAQTGPLAPVYTTYNRMIGERNQSIADFPAVPIYQQSQEVFEVLIQCHPDSAVEVWIGGADNQWIFLRAGETITLPFANLNGIYAEGNNGAATINWLAFPKGR